MQPLDAPLAQLVRLRLLLVLLRALHLLLLGVVHLETRRIARVRLPFSNFCQEQWDEAEIKKNFIKDLSHARFFFRILGTVIQERVGNFSYSIPIHLQPVFFVIYGTCNAC